MIISRIAPCPRNDTPRACFFCRLYAAKRLSSLCHCEADVVSRGNPFSLYKKKISGFRPKFSFILHCSLYRLRCPKSPCGLERRAISTAASPPPRCFARRARSAPSSPHPSCGLRRNPPSPQGEGLNKEDSRQSRESTSIVHCSLCIVH